MFFSNPLEARDNFEGKKDNDKFYESITAGSILYWLLQSIQMLGNGYILNKSKEKIGRIT